MTTQNGGGHRLFAAFWDWVVRHEGSDEKALRRQLASHAHGRVLELGVGVGANWKYLPDDCEYVGIEPDRFMLERARKHAQESGHSATLLAARAENLPLPDESFDAVLVTLTMCSVTSQPTALSEVMRVLKPGGQLLFLEHVRPTGRIKGPLTDLVTPLWKRAAAGCHPNRRTLAAVRTSGFEVRELRETGLHGLPHILGIARKPESA